MNSNPFKFPDGTILEYISFILTTDWMLSNKAGKVMFIGTCDCAEAVANTVPITAPVPVMQCAFCGRTVQLTPMAVYGNETRNWYILPYRPADIGAAVPF
jgi:hypothetical protein